MRGRMPLARTFLRDLSSSQARSPNNSSGRPRGRPRRPRTGGIASINDSSSVTSLRLPPVSDTDSGMPAPSVRTWCFEPGRARSTGLGPLWATPRGPDMRGVDDRPRPVQLPRAVQLSQQQLVQTLPDPGPVPLLETPPAGHTRPEPQLLRQELPLDPGVQHEQDPTQHLPIRDPLPPRIPRIPWIPRNRLGQQRLDALPQPVRHDPRRLLTTPHDPTS